MMKVVDRKLLVGTQVRSLNKLPTGLRSNFVAGVAAYMIKAPRTADMAAKVPIPARKEYLAVISVKTKGQTIPPDRVSSSRSPGLCTHRWLLRCL